MFSWLASIPLVWQILLPSIVIVALIVVLLGGKIVLEKGGPVRLQISRNRRRNCGDCILMMMSKREKLEAKRSFFMDRILKDQMNFVEQKLIEIQNKFTNSYRQKLSKYFEQRNPQEENKQYNLYREALKNSLQLVKDEIRRSFKENGFYHISGAEYSSYIKEKTQILISIAQDYLTNHYPFEGMAISIFEQFEALDYSWIEDEVFKVFGNAKEIKRKSEEHIAQLEKEFEEDIDQFSGTQM